MAVATAERLNLPPFSIIQGRDPILPGAYIDERRNKVPDIIEFVTSDRYLNKPNLYPRQATLLKTIFLQDELYTQYDYDVLEEWTSGFRFPTGALSNEEEADTIFFEGDWGINPDVLTRIKLLKDAGYHWFSTVLAVQGRRSGKGHIGALAAAYVLWHYICQADPKWSYGVDENKRLSCQVFAGKKAQARDNQWRDIVNTVLGAPCFERFIANSLVESLTMYAPADWLRMMNLADRNVETAMDLASFEVVPKEATTMAARGPAAFMQFYDEMAHMVATGVSRSAEEVWNSATPALDQFKKDAFVYCGSSPWEMMGKFYNLVRESLEVDGTTLEPMNPTILTLQLASWDIYQDWERTQDGSMIAAPARQRPATPRGVEPTDGRPKFIITPTTYFRPLRSAIQEYDAKAQREERSNPETFRVERRAKWATAMDAYFPAEHIDRAFRGWMGEPLAQLDVGTPGIHDYIAHGDPGKTGSNFGFAIAHVVPDPDGSEIPHVVFDRVHAWTPGDFVTYDDHGDPHYEMDYIAIEEQIKRWSEGFLFTDLSFDQWNSISLVQRLGKYIPSVSYKPSMVWERTTTNKLNWTTAETMKVALSLDRVHMPYFELAELELKFLRKMPGDRVDHPTSGPVTTKDVYDAISIVVHKAIGGMIASAYGEQFTALRLATAMPGQGNIFSGRASVPGQSTRPLSDPAVQQMFDRGGGRRRSGGRPVPGQGVVPRGPWLRP